MDITSPLRLEPSLKLTTSFDRPPRVILILRSEVVDCNIDRGGGQGKAILL